MSSASIPFRVNAGFYAEETQGQTGGITRKVYDKVGRLSEVSSSGYTSIYTYYANGNRKEITNFNGEKEVYTYDKNNQVTLLVNKKSDGSIFQSYSYTYDNAGNQLTKSEAKGTTTYVYDGLNRLKTVIEPSGKRTAYTYDKGGNRKTESATTGSVTILTTYTYNSQNRLALSETVSPSGTERTAYLYDSNGNMTSKSKSTIAQRPSVGASLPSFELVIKGLAPDKDVAFYNYDNRNQLDNVAEGTTVSTYAYNTDGLRIQKKVNGIITKYLYEGDKVVAEADGNDQIIAMNAYGTNLLARQVEDDVLFYMYNAHGDVTALINGEGAVVATYDYDAFGTVIEKTGSANNSITYAGYQYDEESDLYYLNARYYDSKIARFMSEDTYRGQRNDPLSLNLYSYVSNNPVRYTDPTGHRQVEGTTIDKNAGLKKDQVTGKGYSPQNVKKENDTKGITLNGVISQLCALSPLQITTTRIEGIGNSISKTVTNSVDTIKNSVTTVTNFYKDPIKTVTDQYKSTTETITSTAEKIADNTSIVNGYLVFTPTEETTKIMQNAIHDALLSAYVNPRSVETKISEYSTDIETLVVASVLGDTAVSYVGSAINVGSKVSVVTKIDDVLDTGDLLYDSTKDIDKLTDLSKTIDASVDVSKVGSKTGPKPFGTGPHNEKIAEVASQVKDGKIIAGGQVLPEKALATPGGIKNSRRPDILVEKLDGSIYGINVGKTTSVGAPIKREIEAIYDLEDAGIPMHFVPYFK